MILSIVIYTISSKHPQMNGVAMDKQDERAQIITQLSRYKLSLENEGPELLNELKGYCQPEDEKNSSQIQEGLRSVENVRYDNPYEAYLTAQIQLVDVLIPIVDQHIALLKDGENIDSMLESLEHSIYRAKRNTYTDVEDWEMLLEHLSEDRLEEIEENPKGYGDLLLKELNWLRKYEARWMDNR
jgi:MerR family transcriptional regulator, copper efflux regulator